MVTAADRPPKGIREIYIFKKRKRTKTAKNNYSSLDTRTLLSAPKFDSETGVKISDEKLKIHPESSEHCIYLMQKEIKDWKL